MYKIEQHGKISLRRPKLSKEEVKRLMKKKKINDKRKSGVLEDKRDPVPLYFT